MKPSSCPFLRSSGSPPTWTPSQPYHHLAQRPSPKIYQELGEQGITAMIDEFYTHLEKSSLAPMFSPSTHERSVARSSAFFIQLLGGAKDFYTKKYGPPRMRARHLPFVITEQRRQVWLKTFFYTLDHPQGFVFPAPHLSDFKEYLDTFSKWMVNSSEG